MRPRPISRSRRLIRILFAAVAAAAVLTMALHLRGWFQKPPPDFSDFYAAGRVVLDGHDAYHEGPMVAKESLLFHGGRRMPLAFPAPLPPYDLIGLADLARLPLRFALAVLAAGMLLAGAVTSVVLRRYAGLPLTVAIAAVFFGTLYTASSLGQLAPFAKLDFSSLPLPAMHFPSDENASIPLRLYSEAVRTVFHDTAYLLCVKLTLWVAIIASACIIARALRTRQFE